MKPSVPALSPLLRSNTQGIILAQVCLFPNRERTPSELARTANVSLPTVLREIDRLLAAGFIRDRISGRNHYVRANVEHPLFRPVAEIVQHSYGPLALLPSVLDDIEGVEEAFIYGSWAARFDDQPGPDPNDIDVLAIGSTDRTTIFEAASLASTRLGREVNIRSVSRMQWDAADDLFLRNVKENPLVPIPLKGTMRDSPLRAGPSNR
jgi:DNA-binding transcriptional ArsR family regulator